MLVDDELAARARALLREPGEANGKGNYFMSALGTHDLTAAPSFGLEPPLSPPVVGGPLASAMPIGDGALSGLPTPPPAIRPPEPATPAPAPAPAPVAAPTPQPAEPAPAPAPAPAAPVQPEPPAMAPEPAAPVHDYFSSEAPAPAPAPEPAPEPEVQAAPLMAPPEPVAAPAPAPEPVAPAAAEEVVELPAMAPLEPLAPVAPAGEVELAPIAAEPVAELVPEPVVEVTAEPVVEVTPEPVAEVTPEPVAEIVLPVVEPVATSAPEPAVPELVVEELAPSVPELEELFAPKRTTDFRVVVRLKEGEGVEVGSFRDFGTAMEGAQEVIEQFSNATDGQWPFYAGRFLRPDLIVSVDVVEGGADEL
jgi:hypothetical protein